jgi:mediator of RNA polymerase II transcription subunit 16
MIELSHLEVIPSLVDSTGKNTTLPLIVTARSRTPTESSYQESQSVVDRWEAIEQKQNLPSAYEQLGGRRNSISSELPAVTQLQKVAPVTTNKVVVAVQTTSFGKILVLAFADGTVEYRDRLTFEELYTTQELNKVQNLRQIGWTFADEGPCKYAYPRMLLLSNSSCRPASCILSYFLLYGANGRRWKDQVEQITLPWGRYWKFYARWYVEQWEDW